MSLQRVLSICFLLFALAGNAAWAVTDYHATADGAHAVDSDDGHAHTFPAGDSDGCDDHCCHAGAHFLGLLGSPSAWPLSASPATYLTSEKQPLSHPLSPLFQPPIA